MVACAPWRLPVEIGICSRRRPRLACPPRRRHDRIRKPESVPDLHSFPWQRHAAKQSRPGGKYLDFPKEDFPGRRAAPAMRPVPAGPASSSASRQFSWAFSWLCPLRHRVLLFQSHGSPLAKPWGWAWPERPDSQQMTCRSAELQHGVPDIPDSFMMIPRPSGFSVGPLNWHCRFRRVP